MLKNQLDVIKPSGLLTNVKSYPIMSVLKFAIPDTQPAREDELARSVGFVLPNTNCRKKN